MKNRISGLCLAVILFLAMPASSMAEYIHGYFRYTVEDESVTITAYYGNEDTVTVPAMISGDPVNTIAAGAFADCSTVKVIYLPDTIMTIHEGAFSSGQTVIYTSTDAEDSPADTAEGSGQAFPSPAGMYDENGNLVTTDDQGHLVLVDTDGNETVLDDTQDYTVDTDENGKTVIRNESGGTVLLTESGEISFTDGQQNQVTVSADGTKVSGPEQSAAAEEAEADEDRQGATEETAPSLTEEATQSGTVFTNAQADEAGRRRQVIPALMIFLLCVSVIGLTVTALLRRIRRRA